MAKVPTKDIAREEARIVALLNDHNEPADDDESIFRLVINAGAAGGVSKGDRYIIYSLGPELKDPVSGDSLGALEIVRGSATVVHVQENMSTLRTMEERREMKLPPGGSSLLALGRIEPQHVAVAVPFRSPEIGDFARPI